MRPVIQKPIKRFNKTYSIPYIGQNYGNHMYVLQPRFLFANKISKNFMMNKILESLKSMCVYVYIYIQITVYQLHPSPMTSVSNQSFSSFSEFHGTAWRKRSSRCTSYCSAKALCETTSGIGFRGEFVKPKFRRKKTRLFLGVGTIFLLQQKNVVKETRIWLSLQQIQDSIAYFIIHGSYTWFMNHPGTQPPLHVP